MGVMRRIVCCRRGQHRKGMPWWECPDCGREIPEPERTFLALEAALDKGCQPMDTDRGPG